MEALKKDKYSMMMIPAILFCTLGAVLLIVHFNLVTQYPGKYQTWTEGTCHVHDCPVIAMRTVCRVSIEGSGGSYTHRNLTALTGPWLGDGKNESNSMVVKEGEVRYCGYPEEPSVFPEVGIPDVVYFQFPKEQYLAEYYEWGVVRTVAALMWSLSAVFWLIIIYFTLKEACIQQGILKV